MLAIPTGMSSARHGLDYAVVCGSSDHHSVKRLSAIATPKSISLIEANTRRHPLVDERP